MAIIPQVPKDEDTSVFSGDRRVQYKRAGGAHKVNMVEDIAKMVTKTNKLQVMTW